MRLHLVSSPGATSQMVGSPTVQCNCWSFYSPVKFPFKRKVETPSLSGAHSPSKYGIEYPNSFSCDRRESFKNCLMSRGPYSCSRMPSMARAERLSSFPKYPVKLLIWTASLTVLCALFLLASTDAGEVTEQVYYARLDLDESVRGAKERDPRIVDAKPFITAENSQFGAKIEGTSVDSQGRVYAVDFQDQTTQIGQLSNEKGEVDQKLFFKSRDKESYFNGIRFYPVPKGNSEVVSAAFVADKKGQIIQVLTSKKDGVVRGRVFCKDERMIEPNDVAVAYESGRVYSTGLNYAPTTKPGDGDFWLCNLPSDGAIYAADLGDSGTVVKAMRLIVQGRANGIEVSNDEKHLYVSETWALDMKIYQNLLWKYDIDQETGHLSNRQMFFNMKEIDEELQGKAGDIDGVRTDMAGNLYLVRNGELGEVVKVSPEGKVVKRIKLPGITEPSNVELGGPHGTTLFIVGKCKANINLGCIDVWENDDAPGRAFFNLYRPAQKHVESSNQDEL